MIHLERLPSSIRKLCKYTLQPSLHFSDLTVLCNAWKTLAFSYLFLFSTLSLLLFLWVAFSIDCLCFLMLWRGPGACEWGEKRSSWHTYAPVVNSSSQHSSKYTDLLLFPLPPSSASFTPSFFLQLGAPLNISTPCCSIPKITLWKIKMLKCSNKNIYTITSLLHQSRGNGVEWRDLRGVLEGARERNSHFWAEEASVKPDGEQKWPLHLSVHHVSSICQPTFRSTFDSYSLSHTYFTDR